MSNSQEAVELYNQGLNFAKQSRYTEAIDPLVKATKVDPNYVKAYNVLGKVYMGEGDVRKAQEAWMEALKRDPFNATAMACLEATYPKPFVERFRNVILVAILVFIVGGLGAVYRLSSRIDARLKALDVRLKTLEERLKTFSFQPAEQPPNSARPGQTMTDTESVKPPTPANPSALSDSELARDSSSASSPSGLVDIEFIETPSSSSRSASQMSSEEATAKSDKTVETPQQPQPVKSQPRQSQKTSEPRKSQIPKMTDELETQFKRGHALYERGAYAEALEQFQAIIQSGLSHRHLIGDAHYWAGESYLKLGQPQKALAEFQKVTAANSYREQDALREVKKIQ